MKNWLTVLSIFATIFMVSCDDTTGGRNQQDVIKDAQGMVRVNLKGTGIYGSNARYDIYIDTTEVTQKSYDSIMSSYPLYTSPSIWDSATNGDNYPALGIGFYDAILYCNARSLKDGYDTVYTYGEVVGSFGVPCSLVNLALDNSKNGYRLPNVAEQHLSALGNSSQPFHWTTLDSSAYPKTANDTSEINMYCVWAPNSGGQPQVVATTLPNSFGLYDMLGNVAEWGLDEAAYNYVNTQKYHPLYGGTYLTSSIVTIQTSPSTYSLDLQNQKPFGHPAKTRGFRTVRTAE